MPSPTPNIDLEAIAQDLRSHRTFSPHGTPGVPFDRVGLLVGALACALPAPAAEIGESDRRAIAQRALFSAIKTRQIDAKTLHRCMRVEIRRYQSAPELEYAVLTTIIHPFDTRMRSASAFSGERVHFSPSMPKGFSFPRMDPGVVETPRTRFAYVSTTTRGKSSESALQQGLDTLDYIRGMWNLILNYRMLRITSRPEPLNTICCGRTTSIHELAGAPLNLVSYDPFHMPPLYPKALQKRWARLTADARYLHRRLRRSLYAGQLRSAVIKYCRACDTANRDLAFMQLWAILELLTDTVGQKYADTIKRCAALYQSPAIERVFLEFIRHRRNTSVHHGVSIGQTEYELLQVHRYVSELLLFHIRESPFFRDMPETGAFLALSDNPSSLERSIALRRKAVAFHKPRP